VRALAAAACVKNGTRYHSCGTIPAEYVKMDLVPF